MRPHPLYHLFVSMKDKYREGVKTMDSVDVKIGSHVTFRDTHGMKHNALVTAIWGQCSKDEQDAYYREMIAGGAPGDLEHLLALPWSPPSINVVYVTADPTKTDPYGKQIERATSVPHNAVQPAFGYSWEN